MLLNLVITTILNLIMTTILNLIISMLLNLVMTTILNLIITTILNLMTTMLLNLMMVSRPWHPINPAPLHPITSTRLPPIPLYVPTFPNCLYFPCIATDRWALCPVRLPIRLLNMFPFTIPVTLCSRPVIPTNTICLGESATNITGLNHHAVWAALVVGLPDSPSIAPYILQ